MKEIFVFGSNTAGRHGKGAALEAYEKWGAKRGQGSGRQGNSYAIPTKTQGADKVLKTLPLPVIELHVQAFLLYAATHKNLIFKLTAIGCGLAGYKPEQIGPMFKGAPSNVMLPEEFKPYV